MRPAAPSLPPQRMTWRSAPKPFHPLPVWVMVEIILNVKDALGNPVSGASVSIYADHIDMSGMDMSGQATEQGNGRYAITANFSMSGNWLLKVDVKTEDLAETQEIAFVIK